MANEKLPSSTTNGRADPTANVQNIVSEVVKRIDDLREAETRRLDQRFESGEAHTKELMQLRAEHANDLREAEAKRIDAIRVVDINAVAVANEKATAQATVLANQVSTSAETLRTLVATTATTTATQLDQLTKQLTDRIALLEKALYEGKGKEGVTDPQIAQLLIEMKTSRENSSQGTGKSQGASSTIIYIVMAIGAISTILGIINFIK